MAIVVHVSSHQAFAQCLPSLPDTQECICLYRIRGSQSPCDHLLMPPGTFASSNVPKLEQKLMVLHLTLCYLFLPAVFHAGFI